MSSGGPCGAQPSAPNPFSLSYLFPTQPNNFTSFNNQQKIKLKRNRQRVDAGEPRNSYQQSKMASQYREETTNSLDHMVQFAPWLKNETDTEEIKESEEDEIEDEREERENDTDLSSNHVEESTGECYDDNEDVEESEGPMNSQCTVDEPRDGSDSAASGNSSSSRRKSAQPQKNASLNVTQKEDEPDDVEHPPSKVKAEKLGADEENADNTADSSIPAPGQLFKGLSVLQQHLAAPPNNVNDVIEAQKRLFAHLLNEERKVVPVRDEKPRLLKDLNRLAQTLKDDIKQTLAASIDKAISDFSLAEFARRQADAAVAQAQQQQKQQQQQQQQRQQMMFPPNPFQFLHGTPFAVSQGSGIFPNAFPGFNPLAAFGQTGLKRPAFDEETPRRKRNKVSDQRARSDMSTPNGGTQGAPGYFPPTMVGHPMYGSSSIFGERDESPTNSDDLSDFGGIDGGAQSATLTPIHLRKAKLMFFYTRYPNPTLLKSYFPDIRFNKNNSAQLVKWFSNFREFYYSQMDKFARQAIAEGIQHRDEIVVTTESEIFRQLNQHYNRNNHIEPPERLAWVVQETLREFYDAVKEGRDVDPSWKKSIYKVIIPLDEHVPEYFKDPNFLERLE